MNKTDTYRTKRPYLIRVGCFGGENLYVIEEGRKDDEDKRSYNENKGEKKDITDIVLINASRSPGVLVGNHTSPLEIILAKLLNNASKVVGNEKRVNLLWNARYDGYENISAEVPLGSSISREKEDFDFFVAKDTSRFMPKKNIYYKEVLLLPQENYKRFEFRVTKKFPHGKIYYKRNLLDNKISVENIFQKARILTLYFFGSPGCQFDSSRDDVPVFEKWCELGKKTEKKCDRKILLEFLLPKFRDNIKEYLTRKATNYELEVLSVSNSLSFLEKFAGRRCLDNSTIEEINRIAQAIKDARERRHGLETKKSDNENDSNCYSPYMPSKVRIKQAIDKLIKEGIMHSA